MSAPQTNYGCVLRALSQYPGTALTTEHVSRQTRRAVDDVAHELDTLHRQGLVIRHDLSVTRWERAA